jgi:hypothetical protein
MIEQLVKDDPQFYNNIRGDLISQSPWGFSLQHVESVKSMQDNLNALALIVRFLNFLKLLVLVGSSFSGKATFIAAVQAQVITYAYQSNSTALEVTIFFTVLFLDIVGGCMAYIVAVQLQHIYALLLRRTNSVSQIVNSLDLYHLHQEPIHLR